MDREVKQVIWVAIAPQHVRTSTPAVVFIQSKASTQGVTSQLSFWSLTTASSMIMGRISEEISPLSEVSSEIRQSH
jgi:hypothetical protein